jgi:organic hydroperoxide reductase OsmC/OhrA
MRSILPIPSSAWQHGRMGHEHRYQATITWTGNLGAGTAGHRSYSRDHEVSGKGKPVLPGSSDPAFRGDPKRWNPEELLVAALSQCHMLWFLNLCAANGIVVISYTDDAQGTMAEGGDGGGEFTTVTLRPGPPSPIQARRTVRWNSTRRPTGSALSPARSTSRSAANRSSPDTGT